MAWKAILAEDPCRERRDAVRKMLSKAFPDYRSRSFTLADAAAAGVGFDDLIWIAGRAAERDPDCARRIRLFGADCAARVAHIANDPRSTAAIVASRQFARGEIDDAALAAAWDAARDAAWAAARAAARDAAWDAARDAAWAAALDAAWDAARAAAWDAARAAALDAAWDAALDAAWDAAWAAALDAAWDAEQSWQAGRLVAWFSDNEPTDWPITEAKKAEAA
jgi:hypothetical protein